MMNNYANLEPVVESEQRLFETAYGDPIPFSEFPNNDWADISTFGVYGSAFTSIYDREDGRNFPIYQNEQDLAMIRAQVRRFLTLSEMTEAANTALQVYIFGANGISYSVQPQKGMKPPTGLVEDILRIIDRFADNNSLINSMDVETHLRSRNDGEGQIALERCPMKAGNIMASFIEPDQMRRPLAANDHDFLNWIEGQYGIDCSSFVPSWSFGVLSPERHSDRALGYHVVHNSTGSDFDFFPAEQFVHIKRNVTRNMKRGISDYYAVKDRVSQAAKLMRNMAHGAALQSAIAWVEESPEGTNVGQLPGIGNTDAQYQKPTNIGAGGGTRTQKQTTYGPGSILRPTPGRKYIPGPMGAERNQGFEVVLRCIQQATASRFLMSYQMLSSDASNNNYASSLIAESPFVKAREWDQAWYGGAFQSLLWKVVNLSWKLGWLDLRGVPFSQLQKMVNIKIDWPQVGTRDADALVKRLVQEVTVLGTTSIRTAAVDLGRDYDEEVTNGAKADSTTINPPNPVVPGQAADDVNPQATGELANVSTLQFNRNTKALNSVLDQFGNGTYSRPRSKQLLLALGLQDSRAEALLDDAEPVIQSQIEPTTESLEEAVSAVPTWEEYP